MSPRYDGDAVDPGLAAERTDLAWNRSGLALLACGAAVARGLTLNEPTVARFGVGVTILVLGTLTWLIGVWQARRRSRSGRARSVATPADLLPVALGTACVGVAAFVLGLFFPA